MGALSLSLSSAAFSRAPKPPARAALLTQVPAVWQLVLPRAVAQWRLEKVFVCVETMNSKSVPHLTVPGHPSYVRNKHAVL